VRFVQTTIREIDSKQLRVGTDAGEFGSSRLNRWFGG
jgi:hypothetical protein